MELAPSTFSGRMDVITRLWQTVVSVSNSESTAEQQPKYLEYDLASWEDLSYEDDTDYSSSHEMTLSELESDLFPKNSDVDFSDYTSSFLFESPSDFSERSAENSTPSAYFSLFLQFTQQFSKSASRPNSGVFSNTEDEYLNEFTRFEDEEHEETYKKFRSRERREAFLHDYAGEYCLMTDYGDLILQQRLLMVNRIV
ncbi:hypothetical protein HHK36_024217 [Tetracentron sinense]|uniref:Uncharacterized protein n=1 Tax=Tetracentron sinense TaxID=13715 RepID=A0A835D421_TETSI|nr:hypothetical protein HHK36_024217 [Tetracentron sinense]